MVADGTRAVLKVNKLDVENEREPDALASWDGHGAVRLLARDDRHGAFLIERCEPGTSLRDEPDEVALPVVGDLIGRLSIAPPTGHRFRLLAVEARRWRSSFAVGSIPSDLRDAALAFLDGPGYDGPPVLAMQDMHGGNVLRATRMPFLAIDPKPLVGDPALSAVAIVRDGLEDASDPAALARRRLDVIAEASGLSRARIRGWAIVHTLAWTESDADWLRARAIHDAGA